MIFSLSSLLLTVKLGYIISMGFNFVAVGEKVECSEYGPLTYAFTWNEVLKGPIKEACAKQLAAQRAGAWDLEDCVEEASLMLNPASVESLSFTLVPRRAAVGGAACAAARSNAGAAETATTAENGNTDVPLRDANNAPLATIASGRLVCREVAFESLLHEARTHARLASADYSLVAVVKFRAAAAPLLGGMRPDRLSPFLVLVGRKRSDADSGSDASCGLKVDTQLLRRQHRQGLFF